MSVRTIVITAAVASRVKTIVLRTGPAGKSAYQSYLATTSDSPVLTEVEWAAGGGDPTALTVDYADPNSPASMTITGITDPSDADPLTLPAGNPENGSPSWGGNEWLLSYDPFGFPQPKWILSNTSIYQATAESSFLEDPTAAPFDAPSVGEGTPVVTANFLTGEYEGQLCKSTTGWWVWNAFSEVWEALDAAPSSADINDATALGRSLLTAETASAARTELEIPSATVHDFLWASAPAGATGGSGSWTWTLPANVKMIHITNMGGGGGGGSGRVGATATARWGGGGGYGSYKDVQMYAVATLPSNTLAVVVGVGGAGGAAVSAANTNGNNGTQGTGSTVMSSSTMLSRATQGGGSTFGASGGNGGTTTSGNAGGEWGRATFQGTSGGNSFVSANAGDSLQSLAAASGGGGGGGIDASNVARAGGSAYRSVTGPNWNGANGTAGAATGVAGGSASANVIPFPGIGGGGGGAAVAANGGSGGNGSFPGGAGGGGGATTNGFTSGAGGAGAGGFVRIICFY